MVGYTEALTDPSYRGQILSFTYPLIGNYGVPTVQLDQYGLPRAFESDAIQVNATVVHELCDTPSHWESSKTVNQWFFSQGIPGIDGIDVRNLTKRLRDRGVMMAALAVSSEVVDQEPLFKSLQSSALYAETELVSKVSVKQPRRWKTGSDTVVLIDCGVKYSIIRELLHSGFSVVQVPYNTTIEDVMKYQPAGVVLSNGPGDPKTCTDTLPLVSELLDREIPTLGICLGAQLLALAAGGNTYKLPYGHRGQNKPCTDKESGRGYITSQNHGYAIDSNSLDGTGFKVWFVNSDDASIEGIRHDRKPFLAVQFHPEAAPGPHDTAFVFERFRAITRTTIDKR